MTREMKDSGIEWIGEIPEEWMITSLQRLFFIQAGGDAKKEYYNSKRDKKYCYPVYTNSRDEHSVYAYTSNPIFPANCITVSGRGAIGKAFYRKTPFDAIIRLLVLKPKTKSISEFYTYFIDTVLVFNTGSSAVGQLSTIQIAPYKVAVPPIEEQQSIVNVLNKKTERISLIIKQTQQSIKELKKYKQSLITEAVTKGLDPNMEMKDSGIEWIGEIPSNWDINKMKYVTRVNESKYDFIAGETYIGLENVVSFEGVLNGHGKLATNSRESYFEKENILYSKLRPYLAKAFIADFSGACSGEFIVFSEFKGNKRYLLYWLISQTFTDFINATSYGTKMPRSSWEYIKETFIPRPTKDVENRIVSYLDEQMARIGKLIEDKTKVIEELEDYKKSLIYEYVTGKKEV